MNDETSELFGNDWGAEAELVLEYSTFLDNLFKSDQVTAGIDYREGQRRKFKNLKGRNEIADLFVTWITKANSALETTDNRKEKRGIEELIKRNHERYVKCIQEYDNIPEKEDRLKKFIAVRIDSEKAEIVRSILKNRNIDPADGAAFDPSTMELIYHGSLDPRKYRPGYHLWATLDESIRLMASGGNGLSKVVLKAYGIDWDNL